MIPLIGVEVQLRDELGARARALGAVLGVDLTATMLSRVLVRAPTLAERLVQTVHAPTAARTAADVMCALWADTDPPPAWWSTHVGRMVARSVGADATDAVTHSVAAAMLGVPRGSVGTLVHRGQLDRHPDGGVTRGSVLARLARKDTQ